MPKNPLLQLKPAAAKDKKRNKKKSPLSPQRKIQSPLKTTLVNSPVKTQPGACTSPQKLIDGFLKQEGSTSEKPLVTVLHFLNVAPSFSSSCTGCYVNPALVIICFLNRENSLLPLQVLLAFLGCSLTCPQVSGPLRPTWLEPWSSVT